MTRASPSTSGGSVFRLLDRPVTDDVLAANAALVAGATDAKRGRTAGMLVFQIAEELAALPAILLQRVTPIARPRPIPHRSNGVIRGLCNIRGELVLCADLHAMLGLSAPATAPETLDPASDPRRMIIIGPAGDSWAFEVDGLVGVEPIDIEDIRSPPVTVEYALGAFTTGIVRIDGRCVTVLDGESILLGFKAGLS